jgi:hypothetical protein
LTTSSDSPLIFNCPSCGGRIKTLRSQAGTKCKCPKCTASIVVPAPDESPAQSPARAPLDAPERRRAIAPQVQRHDDADDDEGDFKLSDPVERLTLEPVVTEATVDSLADDEPPPEPRKSKPPVNTDPIDVARGRTRLLDSEPERVPLPQNPTAAHVFHFLADPNVIFRGIVLSLILALEIFLIFKAIELRNAGVLMIGSMFFTMGGAVLGGMFAVAASAVWLSIVRDTSNGCQRIESWPQPMFVELTIDSLYIVLSFILGVLPGCGAAVILSAIGIPTWISIFAVPISLSLVFPVSLLSMLESGSFIQPYSKIIWRSLREATPAWVLFYAASALGMFVALIALLTILFAGYWAMLPVSFLLIALLLVYFRILGLLAWYWVNVSVEESEDDE